MPKFVLEQLRFCWPEIASVIRKENRKKRWRDWYENERSGYLFVPPNFLDDHRDVLKTRSFIFIWISFFGNECTKNLGYFSVKFDKNVVRRSVNLVSQDIDDLLKYRRSPPTRLRRWRQRRGGRGRRRCELYRKLETPRGIPIWMRDERRKQRAMCNKKETSKACHPR